MAEERLRGDGSQAGVWIFVYHSRQATIRRPSSMLCHSGRLVWWSRLEDQYQIHLWIYSECQKLSKRLLIDKRKGQRHRHIELRVNLSQLVVHHTHESQGYYWLVHWASSEECACWYHHCLGVVCLAVQEVYTILLWIVIQGHDQIPISLTRG